MLLSLLGALAVARGALEIEGPKGSHHYTSKDLFELLPESRTWRRLTKTIKREEDLSKYVHNYAAPFKELQTAARNDSNMITDLKYASIAAIELMLDASKTFKISEKEFLERDVRDLQSIVTKALATFDMGKVDKVQPVFSAITLKLFARQRFEDLFYGNSKWDDFRLEKHHFEKKLHWLKRHLKRAKGVTLRHMVKLTADIEEIELRTTQQLIMYRREIDNTKAGSKEERKQEKRVKALGSGAMTFDHSWILLTILAGLTYVAM